MNVAMLPQNVLTAVRQNLGFKPEDTAADDEIAKMTPSQVFNAFCVWQGVIGFAGLLEAGLDGIRGAAAPPKPVREDCPTVWTLSWDYGDDFGTDVFETQSEAYSALIQILHRADSSDQAAAEQILKEAKEDVDFDYFILDEFIREKLLSSPVDSFSVASRQLAWLAPAAAAAAVQA